MPPLPCKPLCFMPQSLPPIPCFGFLPWPPSSLDRLPGIGRWNKYFFLQILLIMVFIIKRKVTQAPSKQLIQAPGKVMTASHSKWDLFPFFSHWIYITSFPLKTLCYTCASESFLYSFYCFVLFPFLPYYFINYH